MEPMQTIKLCEHPDLREQAALWFSQKWGIPQHEYIKSIQACIARPSSIPQWYLIIGPQGKIAAGAGVIDNDFHNRKDLTPNLCALYVEEPYRKRGLAHALLDFVRRDICRLGIDRLYLVTDHTTFYEKCGWEFFSMAEGDDGLPIRIYTAATML